MRIGFLGTGHIAAPMARALARDGHTVTVSERNAETAAACAPVTDISIMLPLGHIEHGGCPLPTTPATSPVAALFGAKNPIIPLASETDLAAYFAASTVLTAALTCLIATSEWLDAETGATGEAEDYAQTLAASYLAALPGSLAESRAGLTYPKTLNRAMLDALTAINLEPTIKQALTDMTAAMRGPP